MLRALPGSRFDQVLAAPVKTAHKPMRPDPLRLFTRVVTKLNSFWICGTKHFAHIGRRVSFHWSVSLFNAHSMDIGDTVTVDKDAWLHAQPSDTTTEPLLVIGKGCFIARRCHIDAKNSICLGDNVLLSAGVLIQDHGHDFSDLDVPIQHQGLTPGGTIHIGEGSWIGQGAVILCDSGVLELGKNCVVAANAVVTRSAPSHSVLAGNPARVVKQYDITRNEWLVGCKGKS